MPRGLHHVELYVSDLERSVQFWAPLLERLGYEGYQNWSEGRSWKLGDTYIVFVQTAPKYAEIPYHRCGTGLNHLAFWVDSRSDVDALTEELRAQGTPILYSDRHPHAGGNGHYAVYFEDPDRIKVEVVAEIP
ncbi:hypothetical protein GF324_05470 [bacterium]|nr:hypothetical protein [bacterium]